MFKRFLGLSEQVGRSLVLPLVILPIAALLMCIGAYDFAWMPGVASKTMLAAGNAVFGNLPLVFAVSIALGFTDNDGVAGFSAMIGYLVMIAAMSVVIPLAPGPSPMDPAPEFKAVLGFEVMDTGVFGGIVIGGITAWVFRRFARTGAASRADLFSGRRLVPVFTGISAFAVGSVLGYVWPFLQTQVAELAMRAATADAVTAGTAYGLVDRLLMPFGLHQVWSATFIYEAGRYVSPETGIVAQGELSRFFAGDPEAGILSGGFLLTMWGIPAAAVALWRSAPGGKRRLAGSVMLLAALTSALTGITEPVEFAFMFAAPVLYLLHALLAGAGYAIMNLLDVHIGYAMGQGIIDLLLYYPMNTNPWLLLVVGPFYALVYYGLFRAMIHLQGFRTFGREEPAEAGRAASARMVRAGELLAAFGGKGNITGLSACMTRLRVYVKDVSRVKAARITALGAVAVEESGNEVQAVFGTDTAGVKKDLDDYIRLDGGAVGWDMQWDGITPAVCEPRDAPVPEAGPEELERLRGFLGGLENIISAEPVARTRLLVRLRNRALMRAQEAREAGVLLFEPGHGDAVQVLVGMHPERYCKLV